MLDVSVNSARDFNGPMASQKQWPGVGKYIGGLNPTPDSSLLDWPIQGDSDSTKCFIYQNDCRVYGDEIGIVDFRSKVAATSHEIVTCYRDGYEHMEYDLKDTRKYI